MTRQTGKKQLRVLDARELGEVAGGAGRSLGKDDTGNKIMTAITITIVVAGAAIAGTSLVTLPSTPATYFGGARG